MPAPKLVIVEIIVNSFREDVHVELCHKIIRMNGCYGRVRRKKLYISKENMKKKSHFIKNYIEKDKVTYSDENKFNLFGPDEQHCI